MDAAPVQGQFFNFIGRARLAAGVFILQMKPPTASRATVALPPVSRAAMPVDSLCLVAMRTNNSFVNHPPKYPFLRK
jgi:hypothetical protein